MRYFFYEGGGIMVLALLHLKKDMAREMDCSRLKSSTHTALRPKRQYVSFPLPLVSFGIR